MRRLRSTSPPKSAWPGVSTMFSRTPSHLDRRLLGEDRDALLALEVARVHHPVDDGLVRAERAGLAEHRVDERGLAVVDVGDDRDVAQVVADGGGGRVEGRAMAWAWRSRAVTHGPARVSHMAPFRAIRRRPAARPRYPRGTAPRARRCVGAIEAAVEQLDHPVGDLEHHRVVGGDHRRHALGPDDGPDQQHDLLPGLGVELAGRLVGQQQPRPVRQRAGDRDPLLLAAGELVGPVLRPRLRGPTSSSSSATRRSRAFGSAPTMRSGTSTFSAARQDRDQAERLEHERDRPPADAGRGGLVEVGDRSSHPR